MKRTLNNKDFMLVKAHDDFFNTYFFAEHVREDIAYLIGHDLTDAEINELIKKFNKHGIEVVDENDFEKINETIQEGLLWDLNIIA